jgi:hypothetical protein
MNEETHRSMIEATILLGDDAEKFKASELGEYLISCAKEESGVAMEALKTIDPGKTNEIILLQTRIRLADAFPEWIEGAIRSGRDLLAFRQQQEGEY